MSTIIIPTALQTQIKIGLLREIYRKNLLTEQQFSKLTERQRN